MSVYAVELSSKGEIAVWDLPGRIKLFGRKTFNQLSIAFVSIRGGFTIKFVSCADRHALKTPSERAFRQEMNNKRHFRPSVMIFA
jgi:hypothetical protein